MDPTDQIVALTVGSFIFCACNSTPTAPPAVPQAPSCPDAGSVLDLPAGDPPFSSISSADLPKPLLVTWRLHIDIYGNHAGLQSFELNSKRAGDVPFLAGTGWKCRFDHVATLQKSTYREIRCSSDGWHTTMGVQGEVNDMWTSAASVTLFNGRKEIGTVTMQPCTSANFCAPAPELP
jgi:hypothetical protein